MKDLAHSIKDCNKKQDNSLVWNCSGKRELLMFCSWINSTYKNKMTLNFSMKNMVKIKVSDTFLKKRGNHKMPIQSKNKIALKGGFLIVEVYIEYL